MKRETINGPQVPHLTITIPPPIIHSNPIHVSLTPSPIVQRSPEFWIQTERTPLLSNKSLLPPPNESTFAPLITQANDTQNGNIKLDPQDECLEEETSWKIASQVFIPFMIAGLGTVGAGILLDNVQHYEVFEMVPEMFVLVPALLGLKGNLEMTLASRVSTQANLGLIDNITEQWKMAFGNLALLQCQSLVLGLVASLLASFVGWSREGEFNLHNALLLTSSSLLTASVASFLLGSLTVFVVVCSRRFNVNPDNIAAPLSASLGDVVTLALLATIASFQFSLAAHNDDYIWVETAIVLCLVILVPMWALFAYKCPYTYQVLYSGWIPVISAVAISSGGGYILNFAVANFKGIAACQPVINGVGGNLVAVQACRISTYLHQRAKLGTLPELNDLNSHKNGPCVSPCVAWFGKNVHAKAARILATMSVPGHIIFISMVHYLKSEHSPLTYEFIIFYLTAALLQVTLLLYLAHCLVHWLWKLGMDPDDAAIPYLTATGDLLGTGFLYVAFVIIDIL